MQLLLLTAGNSSPLPSLEILAHQLVVAPIETPLHSVLLADGGPGATAGSQGRVFRPSAILLDGIAEPRSARAAALTLAGRTSVPRVALLRDTSLAAVTPEWQLADFLTPDASPAEVEVRLRLAVARSGSSQPDPDSDVRSDSGISGSVAESGVEIDESNFVARVHGRTLDLTYKEFELLHFLAAHPARVFTREQLLADVWGSDYFGGTRTVDVHVRRLRAKLGDHEWLISTVRGVGYGFARGRQLKEDAS